MTLSELYLDIELQDFAYIEIARLLSESSFSIQEIETINIYEVFPTLKYNLMNVAGSWTGFDSKWLIEECTKNYNKRNDWLFRLNSKISKRLYVKQIQKDWEKVVYLMENP